MSISSSDHLPGHLLVHRGPATVTPRPDLHLRHHRRHLGHPGRAESTSVGNATIQYADNFVSIVPVPAGVTYVPGSAKAVGGDPTTRGQATVKYCTAPAHRL